MATLEIDLHRYSADDFDTASIRSAAPSYVSEVPSYHTTVSTSEPIPPYSPPANNNNNNNNNNTNSSNNINGTNTGSSSSSPLSGLGNQSGSAQPNGGPGSGRTHRLPTLLPSNTAHISTPGLPPIPPAPRRTHHDMPSLGAFHIPSWSTINTNPTYQRVAMRRAQAALSSTANSGGLMRNAARVLERVNEEIVGGSGSGSGSSSSSATPTSAASADATTTTERFRPLEDPYLVGEEAAARARRQRLAKENGDDVLHREDRRWDLFLAQVRDWDERDRSWKPLRRTVVTPSATVSRGRLVRRFVAGGR